MTKVLQCDRERADALDDALGFLTNNERPIVEKHFALHREEAQAYLLEALVELIVFADINGVTRGVAAKAMQAIARAKGEAE